MKAPERKQLQEIRTLMGMGVPNTKIARKLKLSYRGFPQRVVSLLRKECNDNKHED